MYVYRFFFNTTGRRTNWRRMIVLFWKPFGSYIYQEKEKQQKGKQAKRRERKRNENNTLNISSYVVIANGMYLLFDSDCMNRTTFLPRIQFFSPSLSRLPADGLAHEKWEGKTNAVHFWMTNKFLAEHWDVESNVDLELTDELSGLAHLTSSFFFFFRKSHFSLLSHDFSERRSFRKGRGKPADKQRTNSTQMKWGDEKIAPNIIIHQQVMGSLLPQ